MTETILLKIREHLRDNIISYILLCVSFALGVIFGGYILNTYSMEDANGLISFFNDAKDLFAKNTPDYNLIFKNTFLSSLKTVFFVWILGFTVAGLPVIFFINSKIGFMLGFVSSFLFSYYSYKGILMTVILTFSQCFVYIPVVFAVSSYAISLAFTLTKMLFGKIRYKMNLKYYILNYCLVLAVSVVVLILYSLLESYLTANLFMLISQKLT